MTDTTVQGNLTAQKAAQDQRGEGSAPVFRLQA